MIPLLPFLLTLSALNTLNAHAATPPGIDLARFQSLTQTAADKGEVLQGNDYDFHALSRITPADPAKTHLAEYFSAVGVTDTEGKFNAFQVSVVSENWVKTPEGNWDVDQWIWNAGLDGEVQQAYHLRLQETGDGSVIGDDSMPLGTPEEQAKRWVAKVAEWEE